MGALLLFGEKGIEYPAMPSYLSPFTIMIEGRVSKMWVLVGQTSFLMSEACICLVTLSLVAIANHLLGPHWFRLPFQGREGGPRKNWSEVKGPPIHWSKSSQSQQQQAAAST